MTDKDKDKKPKVYFGCISKEEIPKIFEALKKALGECQKSGDKKTISFEVRGTKDEPKGISFEMKGINDTEYANYVDSSKDYMGKALYVITFSVGAKDEASIKVLNDLFEKMKPMFSEIPFVKNKPGKYEIHFRTVGKRVFVDFISVEGEFFKPFLDLGINIRDYHNFSASLKSQFSPADFFNLTVEELSLKFLELVLQVTGSTENAKYLLASLSKALKDVKLANEKFEAKKESILSFLNMANAFLDASFNFEYDAKELCGAGVEASKNFVGVDFNKQFGEFKTMIEGLFGQVVKPLLEAHGLIEPAKATDIDEFSISITVPQFKNGFAIVIKLPGFSKAFTEKFLG